MKAATADCTSQPCSVDQLFHCRYCTSRLPHGEGCYSALLPSMFINALVF